MAVRGGKRREYRPVWYGMDNTVDVQDYSVGNFSTFGGLNPISNVAIGNFVTMSNNGFGSAVVGHQSGVLNNASLCAILGPFNTDNGTFGSILVGSNLTVTAGSTITCVGHTSQVGGGGFVGSALLVGDNSTISGPGGSYICIGFSSTLGGQSGSLMCIGSSNTIEGSSGTHTLVGFGSTIRGSSSNNVLFGSSCFMDHNATGAVCVGYDSTVSYNSNSSICMGNHSAVYYELSNSTVIGANTVINPHSPNNTAIGPSNTIGYATFATFFMIVPDLAGLANNDWVSLPDGRGGTLQIEFQVDGSFVPFGPPRIVCDVQFAATSTDVGHTLVDTWNNNAWGNFPIISESVEMDGRWRGDFQWVVPGSVGNGQSIVPTVVSGLFTGSTSSGGVDIGSNDCFVAGYNNIIHGNHTGDIAIGVSVVLGLPAVPNAYAYNVGIGHDVAINNALGCTRSIGIGDGIVITNSNAIAIGTGTTVSGLDGIAFGHGATATASQFIVGDSTNGALHYFAVRGNNGGVLDTIRAIDTPADGETGLTIVFNAAGSYTNKTVKGAVAPPGGSILLYMDP